MWDLVVKSVLVVRTSQAVFPSSHCNYMGFFKGWTILLMAQLYYCICDSPQHPSWSWFHHLLHHCWVPGYEVHGGCADLYHWQQQEEQRNRAEEPKLERAAGPPFGWWPCTGWHRALLGEHCLELNQLESTANGTPSTSRQSFATCCKKISPTKQVSMTLALERGNGTIYSLFSLVLTSVS